MLTMYRKLSRQGENIKTLLRDRIASSIADFWAYKMSPTSRIAWLNNESKLSDEVRMENLEWCFRPMLICLRIFGIDFKWNERRSFFTQNLIRLIGLLWLIINVLVTYEIGIELYETFSSVQQLKQKTVSEKIRTCCSIVEIPAMYAAFLFSTWRHGRKLVESFNKIQIRSEIDKKTYQQLRVIIIISIFLSVLIVRFTFIIYPFFFLMYH